MTNVITTKKSTEEQNQVSDEQVHFSLREDIRLRNLLLGLIIEEGPIKKSQLEKRIKEKFEVSSSSKAIWAELNKLLSKSYFRIFRNDKEILFPLYMLQGNNRIKKIWIII